MVVVTLWQAESPLLLAATHVGPEEAPGAVLLCPMRGLSGGVPWPLLGAYSPLLLVRGVCCFYPTSLLYRSL